jgi:hypothetical protein
MNTSDTLSSLAMLKVNADTQGRDYLDYIVPFVCYVLDRHRPEHIVDASVRVLLKTEFGLNLPIHAVELVLRRLAKRKLLRRSHNTFHIAGPIPYGPVEERRATARRQQSVVVSRLREFVKDRHELTWTEQEASDSLLGYVGHFAVECLRTFARGDALPEVSPTSTRNLFVVGTFIAHAYSLEPDVFDCIVVFVKGNMLANALLCADLESLERNFGKVVFYLDTPLILRLFRLWGEHRHAAAVELLDQLRNLKAIVAVFDHTVGEIQRVLQSCEANIDNPKAGNWRMITAMRKSGIKVSDIAMLRGTLAKNLTSFDIVQHDNPPYLEKYQIDEGVLQKALDEDIGYLNPRALQDDVNSVRSIYALRKGNRPLHLEDCTAALVTPNAALAETVYHFGQDKESAREISPVITDFSLANIAWLKAPLRSPELPMFELMADCYAALEPKKALWNKYIDEIDRLRARGNITADEHEVLRSSLVAREELMNLTLGSEEALTEQTLSEILERVRSDLTKEKDEELQVEKALHITTEQERVRLLLKSEKTRKRVYDFAVSLGWWLSRGLISLLVIFLATSAAFSAFGSQPLTGIPWWINLPIILLLLAGALWGIVSNFAGMTFNELSRKLEGWFQRRFYHALCSWLQVDE